MKNFKDRQVIKQVLKDSFGGVLYNVANKDKYNAKETIKIWENMTGNEKESMGGIIKGAMNFLMES